MLRRIVLVLVAAASLCCGGDIGHALPGAAGPVRVVCFVDVSGSGLVTRVVQPAAMEFNGLIDLLGATGGELAVGLIRERSNRSLLRVRLEEPPLAKAGLPLVGGNVFIADKARREYAIRKSRDDDARRLWAEENLQRSDRFRADLAGLLAGSASAKATDVFGAIQRAALFLGEPASDWRRRPRLVTLLVTDGLDNVSAARVALPERTRLILVNGSGIQGVLAPLRPVRVESFAAAVRLIVGIVNEKGE